MLYPIYAHLARRESSADAAAGSLRDPASTLDIAAIEAIRAEFAPPTRPVFAIAAVLLTRCMTFMLALRGVGAAFRRSARR